MLFRGQEFFALTLSIIQRLEITVILTREIKVQALFFLFIWPLLNISLIGFILVQVNKFTLQAIGFAVSRIGIICTGGFFILIITSWLFAQVKRFDDYRVLLILQGILILLGAALLRPLSDFPYIPEIPKAPVGSLAILFLEVIVYIVVMLLLKRQELDFKARTNLQQTELNSLRMQSNPHFLFNTLNLIAFEIDDSNLKAKNIIYDLSDLLQQNVKLAQKDKVELKEELQLVSLYLTLQKNAMKID